MAGAALAAREVDDLLDDVLAALVRRVRLAGEEDLDRPPAIDEQRRDSRSGWLKSRPARLYVAKRRAKPIVSASGSSPRRAARAGDELEHALLRGAVRRPQHSVGELERALEVG